MPLRWYHVSGTLNGEQVCFGFATNEDSIVVQCGEKGMKHLYGKWMKDPQVRKIFLDNNLSVAEVKAPTNEPDTTNGIQATEQGS